MNLIVDAGNTFIKVAVFQGNVLLHDDKFKESDFLNNITKLFKKYPGITYALVSSVSKFPMEDIRALCVFCKVHILSQASVIPFKNAYKTPETLGVDRLALMAAAFYKYPHKNTLVIDAGTCITYDFLEATGTYLGGAISPGVEMRFKALHTFTARLPLIENTNLENFIGDTTETSIMSGVINGTVNEINGIISQYEQKFKDLTVILTGGDSQILSKRLKNTIFANPKFLLEGLNCILELNKTK